MAWEPKTATPIDNWQPKSAKPIANKIEAIPPKNDSFDILKSAAGGIERGAVAAPMVVGDLINGMAAGPQLLGYGVRDTIMGNPTTKNPKIYQPFLSSEEVLQRLPKSLRPHEPTTFGGKVTDLIGQVAGGGGITKGLRKTFPEKIPTLNANDGKRMSQAAYAHADRVGGMLKPERTNSFVDAAEKLTPQTEKGKILAGDSPLTKTVDKIRAFRDKPTSLLEAQEIDESLGDAIDAEFGVRGLSKQGKKIQDVQDEFRKMIAETKADGTIGGKEGFDAWKRGQDLWSKQARLRDIEKIMEKASFTENPQTALKTAFKNLYTNDKRMRGFSKEERKLIERAATSSVPIDVLKGLGSRLVTIIHAGATGDIPGAVAASIGSKGVRGVVTTLQENRAKKVAEKIADSMAPPQKPGTLARRPLLDPKAKPITIGIPAAGGLSHLINQATSNTVQY